MAYYAALTSLKETTNQIMGRIMDLSKTSVLPEFLPRVHILFVEVSDSLIFFSNLRTSSSSRKRILELTLMDRVNNRVNSLRDFISSSRTKKGQINFSPDLMKASDEEEIKEAIYKMEDVLESNMSSQLLPHSNTEEIRQAFEQVEQEIHSFITKITKIKNKCSEMSSESATPDEKAAVVSSAYSSSRTDFFNGKNLGEGEELVGLHDELAELKRRVLSEHDRELMVIPIIGMAGIGKTALVKSVCEYPDVWRGFHYHLFVPVGPNYLLKGVLFRILAQLNLESNDYNKLMNRDENKLAKRVKKELNHKSYIIILDDVWNKDVWINLKRIVPDNSNGSRVLLTTRLVDVAREVVQVTQEAGRHHNIPHEKRFLDKVESWELLRKKVFGTDRYPYELKELGEKIAEKCDGLPLAIISVGNHLAKSEKTVGYWEYVAEKGIASIIGADDELMRVLHPSYEHLPVFVKPLFLYLGVFPQYYEIVASKLIKMWIAEGLVTREVSDNAEEVVDSCLTLIRDNSLVVAKQPMFTLKIKTCRLHIVYWVYCKTQARREKFFHILHTLDDCLEDINSQRRLCIHNNSLFGIKDAYNSIESVSNVRSLLCTGPYHHYPVPICLQLEWLRVFEAVSIRFFEFPLELLKLTLLRYIAITYDGDLPPSISQLINLWYLIVHRHHRIISSKSPSYLPKEIWDMKELLHLQVVGSDLPEPPSGASLGNLLKLLGVSPLSCTKQVLESIPNLKKLGVQIVLPADSTEPLSPLDHLRHLDHKLESLKCDVVNPKPSSLVAARAYPTSAFPKGLAKLSLSGFGYLWDQISKISSSSPNLKKLKLRHCAFQGSSWEVDHEFPVLQSLLLEDVDLRYWNVDSDSFTMIKHLIIRHCYKLQQIPSKIRDILHAIEIVDCTPAVADSAKEHERLQNKFVPFFDVSIVSSWED